MSRQFLNAVNGEGGSQTFRSLGSVEDSSTSNILVVSLAIFCRFRRQVAALAKVLRRGNIWCLNAGENYKVDLATWWNFVEDIKSTNVTVSQQEQNKSTGERGTRRKEVLLFISWLVDS